jgi:hypothetical protein
LKLPARSSRLIVVRKPIILSLALLVLISASSCAGKKYTVVKLGGPRQTEIHILTDYYYENDRKYYYYVVTNGETKVPTTFICTGGDPEKLRFQVLPGGQGDVLGVIETQKPTEVLILYDPISSDSWPHAVPSESFEETRNRGLRLLQKVQAESPTTTLKLSDLQCGTD